MSKVIDINKNTVPEVGKIYRAWNEIQANWFCMQYNGLFRIARVGQKYLVRVVKFNPSKWDLFIDS